MSMIYLANGDLITPDPLPDVLKNKYEQDPNDPTRYRLKWRKCIYHIEAQKKCKKSGRLTLLPWCSLLDDMISPVQCDGCAFAKESLDSKK